MGVLWRLLKPRKSRKPQSYRKYRAARQQREDYAARYAAEHPKPPRPSFSATIVVNGVETRTCEHDHRTEAAAQACGERMAREANRAAPGE